MKIMPAIVVLMSWNAKSPEPGSTYAYAGWARAQSMTRIEKAVNEKSDRAYRYRMGLSPVLI
jgi:hypothetical protein